MSIVQINVSQTSAPAPITYQSTGAFVSQGATNLAANATQLITQPSDITPFLAVPLALSSLAWSGGVVVATTSAAIPGRAVGDVFSSTIAGATPSGYNGAFHVTVTGSNTFTYSVAVNPGLETIPGTYTPPGQGELLAQVNTFFGQGGSQSVYVLELGAGDQSTGPALLETWDQTNPNIFYDYLVPKGWDASTGLLALIALYESLTAKKYFFVTTKLSTYATYTAQMKCVVALIEAPGTPITEFSMAAPFQVALAYAPNGTNRMTPFNYSFLFGVTPYPTMGNSALLATLAAANINVVGTGAEGGISTALMTPGKTLDGNDFTYWYSADWIQLNIDRNIANAVINGNNNKLNPLYYSQPGVDTLQDVAVATMATAISYGLANGTTGRSTLDGPAFAQALDDGDFVDENVVNAVPFLTYTAENPNAYAQGVYGGFSAVYIPQRGFNEIIFNINVTNFLTQ